MSRGRANPILPALCLIGFTAVCLVPAHSPAALPVDEALAEATRYRGWEVASFEVTGLDRHLADDLRDGLALNGKRGLLRTRRPPLFPGTLADDVKRARAFAAQNGFPWAEVRIAFRPDHKARKVGVTFELAPGPTVVIDSLSVSGVPDYVDAAAARGAPLSRGARFTESDLTRATFTLNEALAMEGHPRATVTPRVSLRDSTRAEIVLAAKPGPRCVFAGTRIAGAPDDLRGLVLRNAQPSDGEQYTPTALRRARRNVRELDLFRRVDVTVSEPRDGEVDLLVDLVPRKPRSIEVDLGYWTDDFLRAGTRWRHRNLLRGGRGVELKGSLSRFRRDGSFNVWWLSPFGPRTRLTTRLHYVMELEDGYDLNSAQAEVWASKRVGLGGELQAGVSVADVSLKVTTTDTDAFKAESGLLTSLHLRANMDHVDDLIDPTRGVSWSGRLEWSPP
ncbi:hypothetical protein KKG45_00260, partial [bacterium]|nr:hypothetical protein [bacterium]